jgi:hypothetical protein
VAEGGLVNIDPVLTALIVCSDDRADDLGSVLSVGGFRTFWRGSAASGGWENSEYRHKNWDSLSAEELPRVIDVLFFHAGMGDPAGIPTECAFTREFAFSGPGLSPRETPADRAQAVPIQQAFQIKFCPVKTRHIPELIEYIKGKRAELPSFCRHEETVPALWALAILCQAYAAAGIAAGDLAPDGSFGTMLGWSRLDTSTITRLSGRLAKLWPAVQHSDWWLRSLGIGQGMGNAHGNPGQEQAFLAELFWELELDAKARLRFSLNDSDSLTLKPVGLLIDCLQEQGFLHLVAILRNWTPQPEVVEGAFGEIRTFLGSV